MFLRMKRPAQGDALVPSLTRIYFGAVRHQQRSDPRGAAARRGVQGAMVAGVVHVGRHAELEQQAGDVEQIVGGGVQQGRGIEQMSGLPFRQSPCRVPIEPHARRLEGVVALQVLRCRAVQREQGSGLPIPVQQRLRVQSAPRGGIHAARVGAVCEQPPHALEAAAAHGTAQQIVQHAPSRPARRGVGPSAGLVPLRRAVEEEFEPGRVVVVERGVVQGLRLIRIRSPLDQQRGEGGRLRVRRLREFAAPDRAGQRAKMILPVTEAHARVRAAVEQGTRDGDGILPGGRDGQPSVAHIQQRLPPLRPALLRGGGRPFGQDTRDLGDVAAHCRGVDACVRNVRMPLQDLGRESPSGTTVRIGAIPFGGAWADPIVETCVLEELGHELVPVGIGNGHIRQRGLERRPIRYAVLAGQGVLHMAQPGFSRHIAIGSAQPLLGFRFVTAQSAEPAFRFLPQILEARTRSGLAIHGIFLPLSPGVR